MEVSVDVFEKSAEYEIAQEYGFTNEEQRYLLNFSQKL